MNHGNGENYPKSEKNFQFLIFDSSRQEAEIVAASFACAAAVYEPDQTPSVPGLNFHKEASINPSTGGTKKATEIFLVKQSAIEGSNSHPLLPMVVVAIRGTASWVDRMVNLNGDGKELKLEVSFAKAAHILYHLSERFLAIL